MSEKEYKLPKIDLDNLDPSIVEQLKDIDDIEMAKIIGAFNDPSNNIFDNDEKSKKLISCPHEIIFTISASVLAENLKGEITEEKEISIKTFHIPVPIDKDYKHYMATFFKYLEDKLIEGVDHSNENAKERSYD